MFIELTEALACPLCLLRRGEPPPQGLVTVVEALRGRRVLAGYLGCPGCEARFPIRGGEIDFGIERDAPLDPPPELEPDGDDPSAAVEVAALLGLHRAAGGYYVLGEGLARLADHVAGLAPGVELLVLAPEEGGTPSGGREERREPREGPALGDEEGTSGPKGGVTVGRRAPASILPVLSRRFGGVALLGGHGPRLREAERALSEGGRLAVLRPRPGTRARAEELGLRVLAAEARALVAVRP